MTPLRENHQASETSASPEILCRNARSSNRNIINQRQRAASTARETSAAQSARKKATLRRENVIALPEILSSRHNVEARSVRLDSGGRRVEAEARRETRRAT